MRTFEITLLTFVLNVSAGLLAHPAWAIARHQPCDAPAVFEEAAVNLVVLPYRYTGKQNESLGTTGKRLSLLVKLDAVSHILDYGSVGAVQMEAAPGKENDPQCDPEVVEAKLLGPGSGAHQVRPGNGLVLVWGFIYEESEDFYVQTYAKFLRRGKDESVLFRVGDFKFTGKPSSQEIAFAPQRVSQQQLADIEAKYQRADYIRTEPRDDAPGEPLPQMVAKCYRCVEDSTIRAGYFIEEKRGEWIRIRRIDTEAGGMKTGWLHAQVNMGGSATDELLPELHFIEGSVGYLSGRVAEAAGVPLSAEVALASSQLKEFVKANPAPKKDMSNVVALQLSGILEYLSGPDRIDALSTAAQDFEQARALAPYNGDAISLAVAAQLSHEWKKDRKYQQPRLKAERLNAAGALGADTSSAKANLTNLYEMFLKVPAAAGQDALPKAQIQDRLNAVQKLKERN